VPCLKHFLPKHFFVPVYILNRMRTRVSLCVCVCVCVCVEGGGVQAASFAGHL
jgi:hypothetical protein